MLSMSGGGLGSDNLRINMGSVSYTGERGQPFLQLVQALVPKLQERRAISNQRGKDLDVALDIQAFYGCFVAGHAAQGIAREGGRALETSLSLLALGWLPPLFAITAESNYVSRYHPGDIEAAELLTKCYQRSYKAAFEKFRPMGVTINSEEQLEAVLAGNLTPQQYRALHPAAQAEEDDSDDDIEAAPETSNPFSVESQLLTLLRQAVTQDQPARTRPLKTVIVDGAIISMHAAVSLRCFDLFYAVFGLAGEQELAKFYALKKPGAQGTRSIPQFAAEVEMLHDSVQYTTTVPRKAHLYVFCSGLNSKAIRDRLDLFRNNNRAVTLADLVQEALAYEADLKQEELTDRSASVHVGSTAAKGQQSTHLSAVSVLHQRRSEQESVINKLPAAEKSIIISAYELAETHPRSSNAICQDCKVTAKPHTNGSCLRKLAERSKKDSTPQALAAVSESSEVEQLRQQLESMQMQVAMAAQGMFRAPPKPQAGDGGRQQRAAGGAGSSGSSPCQICGFGAGHGGKVCWCVDPSQATDKWGGPSARTAPEGLISYITACTQRNIPLKLDKCLMQVMQILPRLTPAAQQSVKLAVARAFNSAALPGMPFPQQRQVAAVGMQYAPQLPPAPIVTTPSAQQQLPTNPFAFVASTDQQMQGEAVVSETNPFGTTFALAATTADEVLFSQYVPKPRTWEETLSNHDNHKALVTTRAKDSALSRASKPKSFLQGVEQVAADGNSISARQPDKTVKWAPLPSSSDYSMLDECLHGQKSPEDCQQCRHVKAAFHLGARAAYDQVQEFVHDQRSMVNSKHKQLYADVEEAQGSAAITTASGHIPVYEQRLLYLFKPTYSNYQLHQQERQSLDRLTGTTMETGLTLTTPAGSNVLVDKAINDSGADSPIVAEDFCKRVGLHIYTNLPMPGLRAIDGNLNSNVIGRTVSRPILSIV